jgi:two-component system, sensor histidine kinase FlrB
MLQQLLSNHHQAQTGQAETGELEEAFSNFNQASNFLTEVYRELESQVSVLNSELSNARHERVRQFEEKERIAKRLQNLLKVLPAGVIVLDSDGRIVEHNPAAADLLGGPLMGELWRDIVERSFSPRWDDGHDVTLADNRCVNISTQSLEEEAGQLILIKEVTETRQMQQQLGRLKRLSAMGEMASSLAHQIRTPLSTALLYASNIQHVNVDKDRRNRFVGKLIGRLQHLESLVEDMLLFASGGRFDSKTHLMHELLNEFRDSVEAQLEQTTTRLEIENEAKDIAVKVNRHAFVSILQNLMNNAIQACQQSSHIRIGIKRSGENRVALHFSDNGPGINEEVQGKIFEPFFTTRSQGSGLGLAVADAVIRSHGGQIDFETSAEQGTTFRIVLPLAFA